jgi:DNA (cytosine-5)-methyltransferase 1
MDKRDNKHTAVTLVDFPAEFDESAMLKIYDMTSYENYLAVLSQYLHNRDSETSRINRIEIISALLGFLREKEDPHEDLTYSYDYVDTILREPEQYSLFSEFFHVPFPNPISEKILSRS